MEGNFLGARVRLLKCLAPSVSSLLASNISECGQSTVSHPSLKYFRHRSDSERLEDSSLDPQVGGGKEMDCMQKGRSVGSLSEMCLMSLQGERSPVSHLPELTDRNQSLGSHRRNRLW